MRLSKPRLSERVGATVQLEEDVIEISAHYIHQASSNTSGAVVYLYPQRPLTQMVQQFSTLMPVRHRDVLSMMGALGILSGLMVSIKENDLYITFTLCYMWYSRIYTPTVLRHMWYSKLYIHQ